MKNNSEIRHDLISGNWVIIAPKRNSRHRDLLKNEPRVKVSKRNCPFEYPFSGNEVISQYGKGSGDWQVAILQNKYPAVAHIGKSPLIRKTGTYELLRGFGYHNLVVTRGHNSDFSELSEKEATFTFRVLEERYRTLQKEKEVAFISIFHNWGPGAGATIYHPHYQIITVPIVPRAVEISLMNSHKFFSKHKRCMHCFVMERELKERKRIVFRNRSAVVVAPFVSRGPFQLRVYPLHHRPYFEDTPDGELDDIALALRTALQRIRRKLHDPDYNFYIHTAPVKNKKSHNHYHWHIEVVPHLDISAGFEMGTGIEINTVDPNEAARILRG
jgi:UDPglucose--hexose-1-phosphate uridylyltransferase